MWFRLWILSLSTYKVKARKPFYFSKKVQQKVGHEVYSSM